jgi:uncharacterized C2H2 Zn-finger protein
MKCPDCGKTFKGKKCSCGYVAGSEKKKAGKEKPPKKGNPFAKKGY